VFAPFSGAFSSLLGAAPIPRRALVLHDLVDLLWLGVVGKPLRVGDILLDLGAIPAHFLGYLLTLLLCFLLLSIEKVSICACIAMIFSSSTVGAFHSPLTTNALYLVIILTISCSGIRNPILPSSMLDSICVVAEGLVGCGLVRHKQIVE
jgi:hypothetical protein